MTKEEIMQALTLTAHGRHGSALQEQLAENLARVFAEPKQVMSSFSGEAIRNHGTPIDGPVQVYEVPTVKRGPGRPKKAD